MPVDFQPPLVPAHLAWVYSAGLQHLGYTLGLTSPGGGFLRSATLSRDLHSARCVASEVPAQGYGETYLKISATLVYNSSSRSQTSLYFLDRGNGSVNATVSCSCNMQRTHICKHVQDLLFTLLQQDTERAAKPAGPAIGDWLADFEAEERHGGETHQVGASLRLIERQGRLPRLHVLPLIFFIGQRADGYARLCGLDQALLKFVSSEDRECLSLLARPDAHEYQPIISKVQEEALCRLAGAGRLVWSSHPFTINLREIAFSRYACRLGEPVKPDYWWDIKDTHELKVAVGDEETEIAVGYSAWLFNPKHRVLSPIDDAPRRIEAALFSPSLPRSEVERMGAEELARFASAGIPPPLKPSEAIRIDGPVVGKLLVVRGPDSGVNGGELVGHLDTTIDGVPTPDPNDYVEDGRALFEYDGKLYSAPAGSADVTRDKELLDLGMTPRWQGQSIVYTPRQATGQSQRAAWFNAAARAREHGFETWTGKDVDLGADIHWKKSETTDAHLELNEDGTSNQFNLGLSVDLGGTTVDLGPLVATLVNDPRYLELADGKRVPGAPWAFDLPDGRVLSMPVSEIHALVGPVIDWFRHAGEHGKPRLTAFQAASLDGVVDVARFNKVAKWREGIRKLKIATTTPQRCAPPGFSGVLRPYQLDGVAWLNALAEGGFGGVLADDMGLGKTVQILAHLQHLKNSGSLSKPALVICPTSVVGTWEDATRQFTPELQLMTLQGKRRSTAWSSIDGMDLLVSTYPLLTRDEDLLLNREYSLLVLDEAQQAKNPKTKAALVLRRIQADRMVVVTGTPMENHLGELHTLLDYALPGAFGDAHDFRSGFRTPIEKHNRVDRRDTLTRLIAPFVLRRTKDMVAKDLPPKTETVLRVDLPLAQRKLYEQLRSALYIKVKDEIAMKGLSRSTIVILDALLKMRQACDDPRLVSLDLAHSVTVSAKLEALVEKLHEAVEDGRRVLVFSSFAEMIGLIEQRLAEEGIPCCTLTGSTTDRQSVINRFQSNAVPVFLLSLKAGGVGLNLTAADTVFHYDPWWNPAAENQATDRAHRIGQDKPVFVYKLVCNNTLEEGIIAMQARKAELARAILDDGAMQRAEFTLDDLEALFAPQPEETSRSTRGLDAPRARNIRNPGIASREAQSQLPR